MIIFIFLVVASVFAIVPVDYLQKKREEKKREDFLNHESEVVLS